ncbi:hypothetical protein DFH09DRAFT_1096409 [Mycena vulgaris]|nr:hypothetical protein DFH09DRAFT_1096409 [Mycena vulgaris]
MWAFSQRRESRSRSNPEQLWLRAPSRHSVAIKFRLRSLKAAWQFTMCIGAIIARLRIFTTSSLLARVHLGQEIQRKAGLTLRKVAQSKYERPQFTSQTTTMDATRISDGSYGMLKRCDPLNMPTYLGAVLEVDIDCKYNTIRMDASDLGYGGTHGVSDWELLEQKCNPFSVDVWCLGNMICDNFTEGYAFRHKGKIEEMESIEQLVVGICREDPAKRPTMDDVVNRFFDIGAQRVEISFSIHANLQETVGESVHTYSVEFK